MPSTHSRRSEAVDHAVKGRGHRLGLSFHARVAVLRCLAPSTSGCSGGRAPRVPLTSMVGAPGSLVGNVRPDPEEDRFVTAPHPVPHRGCSAAARGPRRARRRRSCARRPSAARCCWPPPWSRWSGRTRRWAAPTTRCATSPSARRALHLDLTLGDVGRRRAAGDLLLRRRAGAQARVRRRRPARPAPRGAAGRRRGRRHDRPGADLRRWSTCHRRRRAARAGRSPPPPTSRSPSPCSR